MNVRKSFLIALGLTIAGTGPSLAAVHKIAYKARSAAVGTIIAGADGNEYVLVRIPFATFGDDLRYSVFVPAATDGTGVFVSTTHSDAVLTGTNATINGVPARIRLGDSRVYIVSGLIGTASQFLVQGGASVTVEFKIGNTLVTLVLDTSTSDTNKAGGTKTDFRTLADWDKYHDPTAQVQTLNDLIDYIKIVAPTP